MLLRPPPLPDLSRHRPRGSPRRRITVRVLVLLLVVLLGSAGLSYVQALTYPGNASWQVRTVEWVRDHGGAPLVNVVENWWYRHNAPTGSAPAPEALPSSSGGAAPVAPAGAAPPPLLPGSSSLPGEAQWVPSAQRVGGAPVLYTATSGPTRPTPARLSG